MMIEDKDFPGSSITLKLDWRDAVTIFKESDLLADSGPERSSGVPGSGMAEIIGFQEPSSL